jgi:hypothetical protein
MGPALPEWVVSCSQAISGGLVVMVCILPTVAGAAADTSRDDGCLQRRCMRGPKASITVAERVSGQTSEPDKQIEYRLARKQGHWLIYDVLVDGTGLVDGYRAQFARMIRRDGAAGLIDRMQHRLEVSGRY